MWAEKIIHWIGNPVTVIHNKKAFKNNFFTIGIKIEAYKKTLGWVPDRILKKN